VPGVSAITAGALGAELLVDEAGRRLPRPPLDVAVEEVRTTEEASCSQAAAHAGGVSGGVMAVYTEVGDTELEAFLAEYDIGEADSFKGVAEGVENSNYPADHDARPILPHAL